GSAPRRTSPSRSSGSWLRRIPTPNAADGARDQAPGACPHACFGARNLALSSLAGPSARSMLGDQVIRPSCPKGPEFVVAPAAVLVFHQKRVLRHYPWLGGAAPQDVPARRTRG